MEMQLMIWVDAEGISGVTSWEQVLAGRSRYDEGRRLITQEVNAAVRGAKSAGADKIVVVDCHGAGGEHSFRNLIPELLEPGAEYVFGVPWTTYTLPLEQGCDGAIFLGFHAKSGTSDGVLSHTVSESWLNFYINGELAGEIAICAGACGHFGVPVLLVTGDAATCKEAKRTLGEEVKTVCVKEGVSRFSARCLAPQEAWSLIERAVAEVVKHPPKVSPFRPSEPTTIRVEFTTPEHVRNYLHEGVCQVDERTVEVTAENFYTAWRILWRR
ncbi:MAG: M55 family metallopeptidase [Armatimonadota bacterium]